MTSFKAADAVDPLDYDFAPYDPDAKGTVPEPTDDQVAAFYAALARAVETALPAEKLEGVDLGDPMQVAELMARFDASDYELLYDKALDTHAAVCSNQPTREQIAALPFRLRRAFYGAVQGWLRPESSRPATDD